jgi:hypothetical protein
LILLNKRTSAVVLVPILAKREEFRDGYHKTERFSVKMPNVMCISSSYSLDANASRGRARIFSAPAQKRSPRTPAIGPCTTVWPSSSLYPDDSPSLQPISEELLGKKNRRS